jgi:excisionase family DNA binding protein
MSGLPRSGARRGLAGLGSTDRRTTPAPPTPASPPARPPALETSTPTAADTATGPVLYTADQAAELLQVRPSWLRRKAAARTIPCRHVGKHLRFSRADINAIADASAQPARQRRYLRGTD